MPAKKPAKSAKKPAKAAKEPAQAAKKPATSAKEASRSPQGTRRRTAPKKAGTTSRPPGKARAKESEASPPSAWPAEPPASWLAVADSPLPIPSAEPAAHPAQWIAVAGPSAQAPPAFDARTGAWLHAPAASPAPPPEPAAYAKGKTRAIVWNVLLGIDLGILGLLFLGSLVMGIILFAAPESTFAREYNETLADGDSSQFLVIANAVLTFILVGAIPFFWVVGTRVVPWQGALEFLRLRFKPKDWLLGLALVPVMLVSVYALVLGYACVFNGCQLPEQPSDSPMQDIVDNLSWPVVIVIALGAGVGEEILFRGVLQRWVGIWGQAALFGLAHAGNAFPPQVLFAFGLGVAFGYLYRRGWSLTTLIVAHTVYDFVLLAAALLFPDLA